MDLTIPGLSDFCSRSRKWLTGTALLLTLHAPFPAHAESLPSPAASLPAAAGSIDAPVSPPTPPDRITGEYVKGYFTDAGKMLMSPTQWDGSDWLKAGLVIGVSSGFFFADADIKNIAQRNHSSAADKAASVGNSLGNPLYTLPPLGLFYLYGHLSDDPKARRTSLLAVESLTIGGAFTWTIKIATQRSRPCTGKPPSTWNAPDFSSFDTSFPSGHTQSAFSIASVIAEEYGSNPYVPPLAYGLASLTGISRIYVNKHWASDVVFGGAIGYFVGKAVVGYHRNKGNSPVTILPAISQQGYGLVVSHRF